MTREEHNRQWGSNRQPDDIVVTLSSPLYGEQAQYDEHCSQCWLGHRHTWKQHDNNLRKAGPRQEVDWHRLMAW